MSAPKSAVEAMLDEVQWAPVEPPAEPTELPYVTHSGRLVIGPMTIQVLQLSDGKRVIPEDEFFGFFGAIGK